jgi:hypothetical protein
MSRQEADVIAVLIITCDSTRLLIHSGETAVRDESLGRVPHVNLFVAEQNSDTSALLGGRIDFYPFDTDDCRKPSDTFNPH